MTCPQRGNYHSISRIMIQALGNRQAFTMVPMSCGHLIVIYACHCQLLIGKINAEAGRNLQVTVIWTSPLTTHTDSNKDHRQN